MGHEERFPPTRLSAGCGFRKETIAGMRRNGRDAPKAAICTRGIELAGLTVAPIRSTAVEATQETQNRMRTPAETDCNLVIPVRTRAS
jgi:hypothetical protein